MSRREASPEAETTSYSPVRMRLTASSEVPKYLTLAVQPVSFSKGVTQSTDLSVLPSSAYPGQARMLTSPSMSPSDSFIGTSGAENPLSAEPLSPSPPPPEPPLSLPHPAASTSTLAPASVANLCVLISFLHCVRTRRRASPLLLLHRSCGRGSRRGRRRGRAARTAAPGPPPVRSAARSRGSARGRRGASRRRCPPPWEIGRASWRERVEILVVA